MDRKMKTRKEIVHSKVSTGKQCEGERLPFFALLLLAWGLGESGGQRGE